MITIRSMRRKLPGHCLVLLALLAGSAGNAAEIMIGASALMSFGSVKADLGGADITLNGQMNMASSVLSEMGDLVINSGGTLQGSQGTFNIKGSFKNNPGGVFDAGLSSMIFQVTNAIPSLMTGNNSFHQIKIESGGAGQSKSFQLPPGGTQTIKNRLEIPGTSSDRITLSSTSSGQKTFIRMEPSASQKLGVVNIKDVDVVGKAICVAPGSILTNITICQGGTPIFSDDFE